MSRPNIEFVERAGAFAREAAAPDAERNDREHRFPREVTAAAAKLGLLGMTVPEAFGGSGVNMATYAAVARELGSACAGTTVGILVSNLAASCIVKFGNDDQKQKYLPGLCDFSRGMGSFCLSEAGSASDAAGLKATAVRAGDRYVLNGQKVWITNGSRAGVLIVMAVTDAGLGANGISAFIVEPSFPGFSVGRVEDKLGQHASNTVAINLEDCVVPAENRLGPEGIGFRVAMAALDGGRIGVGGMANGIGRAALDGCVSYARARGIENDQWAQWLIANTATDHEAGWLMVQRAAAMCDAGVPFSREAAMAKYFATEGANRAAAACLKLAGPLGFDDHGLAARLVRDARITAIYEGTSEIQKVVIARSLSDRLAEGVVMIRSHVEEFSPALAQTGPMRERALAAFRARLIKRQLWAALFSEVDRGGGLALPTLVAAVADAATVDMGLTFVVAVHNACLSGFFARATTSTTVPEHMPAAIAGETLLYWLDGSKGHRLTAQKQPRGWKLRGGFDELPGAAMAGVFLAVGVTGETPALLVVPAAAAGVTVQTTVAPGDPSRVAASVGLASVTFNDVTLPDEALLIGLGERANGVVHFELLDILGAAIGIGVATATLGPADTRPGQLMTELEKLAAGYDRRRKTNQLVAARALRADAFALAREALTERHGTLLRAGDQNTARLSDDATLMTLKAIDRALG